MIGKNLLSQMFQLIHLLLLFTLVTNQGGT